MKQIIMFKSDGCFACKQAEPFVKGKVKIVDVDKNNKLADESNVRALPTFDIMEDGKVKKRIVGWDYKTKKELGL